MAYQCDVFNFVITCWKLGTIDRESNYQCVGNGFDNEFLIGNDL